MKKVISVWTGPKVQTEIARITALQGDDEAWNWIERRWVWKSRYPLAPWVFIAEPD
jgi:hypothetical protein